MLLFAYGSNLASAEVGGGARFAGPALLPDHRLVLTRRSVRWGGGVVDVVAAPGEHVWGAAYETAPESLERLDRKEGAGFAYRRRTVRVSLHGEMLEAVAYEVIAKDPDVPPATPAYAEVVLGGARERGLPDEWLTTLRAVLSGAASVPAP